MGRERFSTSPSESAFLRDDPTDPSRALIRQVLGAVSEYERKMITVRLRAGRARKASSAVCPAALSRMDIDSTTARLWRTTLGSERLRACESSEQMVVQADA
jgi:hypothetical protein